MTWDYAEANAFSDSTGSMDTTVKWITDVLQALPCNEVLAGFSRRLCAQSDNGMRNIMVSTDPPYYDNIGYADLSDFFYVWLRRSLRSTYPQLFGTMLVPKHEELVATPYRENRGKQRRARLF